MLKVNFAKRISNKKFCLKLHLFQGNQVKGPCMFQNTISITFFTDSCA